MLTFAWIKPLQWRHNGLDGVSNHQPHHCLLSRLFRGRSMKTSKFRVTGLCAGNSPGTGEFLHKWPVTRKMFPFDDVIMQWQCKYWTLHFFLCWRQCISILLFIPRPDSSYERTNSICTKMASLQGWLDISWLSYYFHFPLRPILGFYYFMIAYDKHYLTSDNRGYCCHH